MESFLSLVITAHNLGISRDSHKAGLRNVMRSTLLGTLDVF